MRVGLRVGLRGVSRDRPVASRQTPATRGMTTTASDDASASASRRGTGTAGTSSATRRENGEDDRGRETTTTPVEEATREGGVKKTVGRKRRARGGDARGTTRGTLEPFKHRAREDPEVRRVGVEGARRRGWGWGWGAIVARRAISRRRDWIRLDWIGLDRVMRSVIRRGKRAFRTRD